MTIPQVIDYDTNIVNEFFMKGINMFKLIATLALLGHGIGHLIGVSAAWTPIKMGFTDQPWIFSPGININSGLGRVFGLVWLLAMLTTIGAGFGLYFRQEWWLSLTIGSALISLLAVIAWFRAFPSGANMGALGFDILILIGLLGPWSERIIQTLQI
jgi:hypothetical protein